MDYVIDRRLPSEQSSACRPRGALDQIPLSLRKDFLHSSRGAQRQPAAPHYSRFHAHCVISQAQSCSKNAAAAAAAQSSRPVLHDPVTAAPRGQLAATTPQLYRHPICVVPAAAWLLLRYVPLVQICPLGAHARFLTYASGAPEAGKEGKVYSKSSDMTFVDHKNNLLLKIYLSNILLSFSVLKLLLVVCVMRTYN